MKLQTSLSLTPQTENQIDYNSKVFATGSCFVENIGRKLEYFQFQNSINPFGILFNPVSIENYIKRALTNTEYKENEIFEFQEQWKCFDAHSQLNAPSSTELLNNLNSALEEGRKCLKTATHIIITLGTAWVYKENSGKVVANCHKRPNSEFQKELLSISEIENSLKSIYELVLDSNKSAQLIFTISPVRHLKDGFVENNRSKAHLISALHAFLEGSSNCYYFPAYEVVMDELRDYRFYERDMLHPNNLAIDYVWEKFKEVWISDRSVATLEEVKSIRKGLQHKPFNTDSQSYKNFQKNISDSIRSLEVQFPHIKFDSEHF